MRPQSAKGKGRRFQQKVRDRLLEEFSEILREGDVKSTSMGAAGDDILLSPLAQMILPFSIECKNVEKPQLWQTLDQAGARCGDRIPAAIFSRNHVKLDAALVVMPQHHFSALFRGEQFNYDWSHGLIPCVTNLSPVCLVEQALVSTSDATGVPWTHHRHEPPTFNLWAEWNAYSDLAPQSTAVSVTVARTKHIFTVIEFKHFIRLVKNLWEHSAARQRLLPPPPASQ